MWGRLLRAAILIVPAATVVCVVTLLELADISSRQQAANRHPQQQSGHTTEKQDWTTQIAVATDWLDRHREWVNIIFTGFVAVFTGTLWGATKRLAHFAQTQAGDMQDLLRAARDNTTAAASQAEAMKQLHAVSEAQERVMREQAETMAASLALTQKSAEAATKAADIAEKTLISTDRPWVGMDTKLSGRIVVDSGEYRVPVDITLTNYGKSPALSVDYFIELCGSVDTAVIRHHQMINSVQYMTALHSGFVGKTLFPGFPDLHSKRVTASRATIDGEREKAISSEGTDQAGLYIVACAYYRLPGAEFFRHTTAVHQITTPDYDPFIVTADKAVFEIHQSMLVTSRGQMT